MPARDFASHFMTCYQDHDVTGYDARRALSGHIKRSHYMIRYVPVYV